MRTQKKLRNRPIICNYKHTNSDLPTKNKSSLEWISVISPATSLHYFLSFKWLYYYLKPFKINLDSTISIQDIKFNFIDMNWVIISPSLYGLIIILVVKLVMPISIYDNLGSKSKEGMEKTLKGFKSFYRDLKKAKFWIKLLFALSIPTIMTIVFLSFPNNQSNLSLDLKNKLIVLWLVMPALYLFLSGKRALVSSLYSILIFSWANSAMNDILKNHKEEFTTEAYEVEFEFKDRIVKSSPTLKFVYNGAKNTIMIDISKDTIVQKFPAKYIGEFKYSKTKFE